MSPAVDPPDGETGRATRVERCDVAVVGGGPAGLALATELKRLGVEAVTLLERDAALGGAVRHCGHSPFGLVEFRRLMRGPAYARRLAETAEAAGVRLRRGVAVTAFEPGGALALATPDGPERLEARRVALCLGAREASRAQRFIGGERPQGVLPTGALQAMVYLEGLTPFRRPVILGSELVAFSALLTCRHAGMRPVAMIEPAGRIAARAFARALPAALGVPLHHGARIRRVIGRERLEAVEIETTTEGAPRRIEADGLIVTGRFRPEAALLHLSPITVNPATGGPEIDQFGRASDPAYYAAGNLVRPVETAAWCHAEGREAARRIAADLAGALPAPEPARPLLLQHEALRYVAPQRLATPPAAAGGVAAEPMRFVQLRLARPARGRLIARCGEAILWSRRIDSVPERRLLAPLAALTPPRDAAPEPIRLTIEED